MKQFFLFLLCCCLLPSALAAVQDTRQLEQAADRFLQAQQGKDGFAYQLRLPARMPQMPRCEQPLQAAWPAGDARPQRNVLLSCPTLGWSLSLPLDATELQQVLVTTRLIRAGEVLQAGDIRFAGISNRAQLRQGLTDERLVIGQMVRSTMPAGVMLTSNQLRSPYLVRMNQPVRVLVRGDGFTVSSDGVALGNAGAGERVNIRVANGKVVSALVEADGAVSIQLQ